MNATIMECLESTLNETLIYTLLIVCERTAAHPFVTQ